MTNKTIAQQIAELLNRRNQLKVNYTAERVNSQIERYVIIVEEDTLIACAEVERVQWYQHEIKHVSVLEGKEGKGVAAKVLKKAEQLAISKDARVLQCTIRSNNERSMRLFQSKGYVRVNQFYNKMSGNWVLVYQKVVSIE
jgi:N-acetylglutamate synthase-like GNAT family acetyltransferase